MMAGGKVDWETRSDLGGLPLNYTLPQNLMLRNDFKGESEAVTAYANKERQRARGKKRTR